jgi:hypothetical protein
MDKTTTINKYDTYTRNWVDSVQDRDYWRALVNAALKLKVSYAMELEKYTKRLKIR